MLFLKNLQQYFSGRGSLIHVVLDGWCVGAADETNAVNRANLPVMSRLIRGCPYTQLWTHGKYVGLPNEKDMGGSEVGHMTMGAGMVMEQGPTLNSSHSEISYAVFCLKKKKHKQNRPLTSQCR